MKSSTLIKFNWTELLKAYSYDCIVTLKILENICLYKTMRFNPIIIKAINSVPDCWLLDRYEFHSLNATEQQKCIYLHIATRRNWMDYVEFGTTSVPLYVVEDMYNIDTLRTNPLLTINDDNIDLKY